MTAPTKQEAIQMAHDAGLHLEGENSQMPLWVVNHDEIHTLVAAAYARGVADIADWIEPQRNDIPATGAEFAAAIRNRSK